MKKNKVILGCAAVLSVVLLSMLVYILFFRFENIEILIQGVFGDSGRVLNVQNTYFGVDDGRIYNLDDNSTIYQTNDKSAKVKVYDDIVWVFDENSSKNLVAFDAKWNMVGSYEIPSDIIDFLVCSNVIFCIMPNDMQAFCLKEDGSKTEIAIEFEQLYIDEAIELSVHRYKSEYADCVMFKELEGKHSYYVIADAEYKHVIEYVGPPLCVLLFDSNRLVYSDRGLDKRTFTEYCFSLGSCNIYNANVSSDKVSFMNQFVLHNNDEYIVCFGQTTSNSGPKRSGTSEMKGHISDHLYCIDKNDFSKQFEHKTKTFERIIYADSEKAITYYDGEYLTYSFEDWKVIGKQDADEIKDGGSYFFEACGEYLFVFDDKTDKLINKIKV